MKASDLFIKCLENENIEYIFGVPGEENADFLISLKKSKKIKFILEIFLATKPSPGFGRGLSCTLFLS